MKKGAVLSILLIILAAGIISSSSVLDNIPVQIQTTDSGGNIITGTFTFQVNISSSSSCNPVLYSNMTTMTTDSRGIVSYQLINVTLPFDQQYYFCYYRNGNLQQTIQVARTPYAFIAKNISASGIVNDSNFNISNYNVTASAGFFSILGNLLNPILNFFVQNIFASNNITATGNVSAAYFFGNGSQLTGIAGGSNPSYTNVNISNLLTLNPQLSPTGANNGSLFYNSSLNAPMFYNGTTWIGLPGGTGASIISSGSNVNGNWVQYADGTMIEWNTSTTSMNCNSAIAAPIFYGAETITFPLAFVSTPTVTIAMNQSSAGTGVPWPGMSQFVTTSNFQAYSMCAISGTLAVPSWIAIGRWTNLNLGTGSGGGNGIVNTVSNTNGTCTQYANGIMDCFGNWTLNNVAITSARGQLFYAAFQAWTFPTAFTNTNISVQFSTSSNSANDIIWVNGGGVPDINNTAAGYRILSALSQTVTTIAIQGYATGRWTNSTNINTPDVSTWGLDSNGNIQAVNSSRQLNLTNTNTTYYAPNASEKSLGTPHLRDYTIAGGFVSGVGNTSISLVSIVPAGATQIYYDLECQSTSSGTSVIIYSGVTNTPSSICYVNVAGQTGGGGGGIVALNSTGGFKMAVTGATTTVYMTMHEYWI